MNERDNNEMDNNEKEKITQVQMEILKIGWPAIIENLFTTFSNMIDSKMVGVLGVASISAVSVTNQPRLFLMTVFFAITTTIQALVARNVGSKDRKHANDLLLTAVAGTVILSVIISVLSIIFARPIMILCSNQPDTLEESIQYFRVIMGGLVFNNLLIVINSAFRGCGKTGITLTSNIVSCVVDIFFNYLLIEGHWGFPKMGVRGAALATVLGFVAALIVSVLQLFRKDSFISFWYCIKEKCRPCMECISDLMGMWRKLFLDNFLTRVGFLLISMVTARIGSFGNAVYSVGMHLMNVNFAVGSGFQAAAIALIGRSLGEQAFHKIKIYSRQIISLGFAYALVLAGVIALTGAPYFAFFNEDPVFISVGAKTCYIIAVICVIQVPQIIYSGILIGLADVKYTLITSIISNTLLNTILVFVLVIICDMGLWGVWISTLVAQTCRMLMLRFRYRCKEEELLRG